MGPAELPHPGDQERQHDPDRLRYGGNRCILLKAEDKLPEAELRHCVALALTYHLGKRKSATAK